MSRLYIRIYAAVLASLVVFALAAAVLWRYFASDGAPWPATSTAARLAQNVLPPAAAPDAEQQAALERIGAGLRTDLTLFAPDGRRIAATGSPIAHPPEQAARGVHTGFRAASAWFLRLPDGRLAGARLAATEDGHRGGPGLAFAGLLLLLLVAVAIAAHPVVRRITRRIEQLQAGVDTLERGDLSARVPVRGHDEIAQLARGFNRAAARIEALVASHRMLLANASHELRTPLTRIRMGVELLQGTPDRARRAELERDIAELDRLIEGILLASRLDATQQSAPRETVDLLALAAEECARYDGCSLDGEPATVDGDPDLLRRLIRNLLDNAASHGAPPVTCSVRRVSGGAELRVADHGPGVDEAEREAVFEPFRRGKGARSGTGSGLGLALVRRIARHHGGDAWIDASVAAGTTLVARIGVAREAP